MTLRTASVLSAFLHLVVLVAINHATVARNVVLHLPSGILNVDLVQAVGPKTEDRNTSQAPDGPVVAVNGKQQDRQPPQTENKIGTASSRPSAAAGGASANQSSGITVPDVSRPPDAFAQAMTQLMYSQWMTRTAVRYIKMTHALVLAHLQTAIPADLVRELEGQQATVVAVYAGKNELRSLAVDAKNEKLRSILQSGLPWSTIPAPGSLSLPYREMIFHVSLEAGKIYLRLSPGP